ncbi:MAG TPA: aspartate 1-decarboxylase [Clostridium sp.]|nr:aspartate 1-decarboxylase [Clostridium sp. Bc-iso-3]HHV29722.1 aspartate 1-decarboxylase [Clostridium sp.]
MFITLMKSKIHRATVTEANLNYVGSITIDEDLMDAADIIENEKVQVVDNNNGNRFETYVIKGERGSGMICLNGAAARLVHPGDLIIIISYGIFEREEAKSFNPKILFVDEANKIFDIKSQEKHGEI